MFQKLFTRRRGVALAAVAIGMSGMSLAFAGTAGAVGNNLVAGGGSNTTYYAMSSLSNLFNQSPGCDLAGTSKPKDGSCAIAYATGSTVNQPGENGLQAAKENPYNDVSYEYPAVGSGTGVQILQQAPGTATPETFARSSATPANSHGTAAQNYVEYAIDGVDWVHFTAKTGATGTIKTELTDQALVTNLTVTQLTAIYAGTLTCTVAGHVYTENWICLEPAGHQLSNPIHCYMAQTGSGTEKTWASYITGNSDTPGCLSPTLDPNLTGHSHAGLFENEVSAIVNPTSIWYNNDYQNAFYYFSYGKYTSQCPANHCVGATAYTTVLPKVNNIAPTKTTIQGSGGGLPGTFPLLRYLSNVYNNTSTGTNGVATQATLNMVGEDGFLCKPTTVGDIDPLTGVSYRTEIEAGLTSNGFFPIDTSPAHPFAEGSFATTVPLTDPNYQLVDPQYVNSNPSGFCLNVNG